MNIRERGKEGKRERGRGRERARERERERGKPENRLLYIENKLRVAGGEVGGGWVKWVMGIKECTGCNEHWVLYVSDESLNSTPETNITLHIN